jgi:hypothetical protein
MEQISRLSDQSRRLVQGWLAWEENARERGFLIVSPRMPALVVPNRRRLHIIGGHPWRRRDDTKG